MEDKETDADLEEQEALELLESIKKMRDREKQLLKENAFVYFRLWSSVNNSPPAPPKAPPKRVKVYPLPAQKRS